MVVVVAVVIVVTVVAREQPCVVQCFVDADPPALIRQQHTIHAGAGLLWREMVAVPLAFPAVELE